mmetsp:Transcript_76188/g.168296  ORF Transcript_76188/g.168296 Transcript_76188/m.168296 type:complete len:237 (-) Transcript_76188:146-856(-)
MLRAVCCCVLLDLICSRCVVNKSGTMTFCSSLGQSQCMTSDGLCSWDASLALSPLATHGCKYLYYMNSSGTDLYQDEKVACSLLQTKETCQSAGRSIGNFGCQWWDVDQCSTENQTNQTTVFKPFWGCKSQATCESVAGYWCTLCSDDDLAFIWRESGHYTNHLLALATEGRGKCVDECAKARTDLGFENNKRLCDKISGCGFAGVDEGICFQVDDAKDLSLGLSFLCAFLVLTAA